MILTNYALDKKDLWAVALAAGRFSSINLESEDYLELTEMICKFANQNCDGRIVSILEGGYNLDALTESVKLHLQSLLSSV